MKENTTGGIFIIFYYAYVKIFHGKKKPKGKKQKQNEKKKNPKEKKQKKAKKDKKMNLFLLKSAETGEFLAKS